MRVRLRWTPAPRLLAIVLAVPCMDTAKALAQEATDPAVLRIPAVSRAPTFEDFAIGGTREGETRVSGFRQYEPVDGAAASQDTIVYLSHDADHLYVTFVCRDDPQKIRAHLSRREDATPSPATRWSSRRRPASTSAPALRTIRASRPSSSAAPCTLPADGR